MMNKYTSRELAVIVTFAGSDDVDASGRPVDSVFVLSDACVVTFVHLLQVDNLQPPGHLPLLRTAAHVHRYAKVVT